MRPQVAILDYGCGNLASVVNAVRKVGGDPEVVDTPFQIDQAERIILPGQGAYRRLHPHLASQLDNARATDKPILGICLGMQLMCESSEEAPGVKGLGWLRTKCMKLNAPRLPHVGWNTVGSLGDFYFCHSYAISWRRWDKLTLGEFLTTR